MTLKKHNPGCNCCGCLIIEDDFTSDPYAANFTEVGSQTWNSGGESVDVSGSAPSLAVTTAEASTVNQSASASFANPVDNDWHAVFICYEDSDTLLFAEARVTSTSLEVRVGHRAGGANTVLATSTAPLGDLAHSSVTFAVCYDGTRLHGYAITNGGTQASIVNLHSYSGSGRKAGFGYIRAPSTDLHFSSFTFGRYSAECDYCISVCNMCIDNKMSHGFLVEVPALGNGTGNWACTSCADEAATYAVENYAEGPVVCSVTHSIFPLTDCLYMFVGVYLILGNVGTQRRIRVVLCSGNTGGSCNTLDAAGDPAGFDTVLQYEKIYGDLIDCRNLVDEEIPFAQQAGTRMVCDGTGTSVRITSLGPPA